MSRNGQKDRDTIVGKGNERRGKRGMRWGDKGREMGRRGRVKGEEGFESKVYHCLAWPATSLN